VMVEKLLQFFVGEINAKLFEPVELHGTNEWEKNKQIRLACTRNKCENTTLKQKL